MLICFVIFIFLDYGVRPIGYKAGTSFVKINELVPEILVPDLTGFKVDIFSFFIINFTKRDAIFFSS